MQYQVATFLMSWETYPLIYCSFSCHNKNTSIFILIKSKPLKLPVKHTNKHLINITCYLNALDEPQTMKSSTVL